MGFALCGGLTGCGWGDQERVQPDPYGQPHFRGPELSRQNGQPGRAGPGAGQGALARQSVSIDPPPPPAPVNPELVREAPVSPAIHEFEPSSDTGLTPIHGLDGPGPIYDQVIGASHSTIPVEAPDRQPMTLPEPSEVMAPPLIPDVMVEPSAPDGTISQYQPFPMEGGEGFDASAGPVLKPGNPPLQFPSVNDPPPDSDLLLPPPPPPLGDEDTMFVPPVDVEIPEQP